MKPSARLIAALCGLLALSMVLEALALFGIRLPAGLSLLGWALLSSVALLALYDAWQVRRLAAPQISRQLPTSLPLGRWSEVQIQVEHTLPRALQINLFDHTPASMQTEQLPQRIILLPGQISHSRYRLKPLARGHYRFTQCELLMPSPLKLWLRRERLPVNSETRVLPDFAHLYSAQLNAPDRWLQQLGVRQTPRRGLGQNFQQLREYRDGDTLRQIDWKATARKHQPIVREYQNERDQQIVFMLDCGRRMRSQDDELTHFDHALNACLLLSHVALRQGDGVGLSTFACEQPRFVAPQKGSAHINTLMSSLYDLQASLQPADYLSACNQLLSRQRRRALVVIITNLRDDDDQALITAVQRLSRQHQVLLVSLREGVLDGIRQRPVANLEEALKYCGALDYLNARSTLHERLNALGVPLLEAHPNALGPELVSRYLAIKKSAAL